MKNKDDDNNDAIRAIPPEEVTSADILCGRGRRSYDHLANHRIRYLTDLNSERYIGCDNSRGAKINLVQSMYLQILECGGRFLEERHQDGFFVPVSERVARNKIRTYFSRIKRHALKSSVVANSRRSMVNAKAILNQGLASNRFCDDLFMAVNARILRVTLLPRQVTQANFHNYEDRKNPVEHILDAELEAICDQITTPTPSSRTSSITVQHQEPISILVDGPGAGAQQQISSSAL
eukprot:CAMPEP_0119029968 /NCGR_PEP_ID=MMETSP1176-20130426/40795_1 /TAXON_ID=265551 /ORGANISM="Synedropsis recta cf, Strain CCMP1620" /LENGTH=235 /DNA_ID=CAMNT_0006986331 /DNA_START=515 /DNA_END=1222 /DNA_ORIENTATION=+